jgi:hypothetical protein
MKEHSIWFWLYWGLWVAFTLGMISENTGGPSGMFALLLVMIVFGYIGYMIGKWVYDRVASPQMPATRLNGEGVYPIIAIETRTLEEIIVKTKKFAFYFVIYILFIACILGGLLGLLEFPISSIMPIYLVTLVIGLIGTYAITCKALGRKSRLASVLMEENHDFDGEKGRIPNDIPTIKEEKQ